MRSISVQSHPCGSASLAGLVAALSLLCVLSCQPAAAAQFAWSLGEDEVKATINTSIQAGAQWRVEKRANDLVGKVNLNPDLCPVAANGAGTSCQGHLDYVNPLHQTLNLNSVPGEGPGANQVAKDAPGAFSNNHDDGDLNYDRGDVTQAVGKIGTDLNLSYKKLGLFLRGLYFYDAENRGRRVFHPDIQTANTTTAPGQIRRGIGEAGFTRRNDAINDQIGNKFQLLDANISGSFPFIGGRELTVKVGRQPINWGESTLLIVNSLNTFNPPNQNNLFRPAFLDLAEVLTPIGAVSIATSLSESLSLEAFYQYDWEPAEIAAPGSYLSTADVGSDNAYNYLHLGFGKAAEDPNHLGIADQILLSPITDTGGAFPLLKENRARKGGQYGVTLKYYADNINNGTEFGFYAANYHSRLPYLSFYAGQYGCLSGPGAPAPAAEDPLNLDLKGVLDIATVVTSCPGVDAALLLESVLPAGLAPPVRDQNIGANGDAFPSDSIAARLEYPEDIKLYGLSFNTSFGEVTVQGEVAYRPHAPLQVDDTDLAFAALQNIFPRGNGTGDSSDRFDIGLTGVGAVAQLPGSRYAVPDFVSRYRGRDPQSYAPGEYIRGWEEFATAQYNIGGTYIFGPGNWFKANQILVFGELGATQMFNMPDQDELQIDGPGTYTHASAGTDGSGADGGRQSNSGVIGPSGIRFNPTQQKDGFATAFSWGYRVIGIFRYDNVFPGISFENTLIWAQDIDGVAPGPGENFVEGRKNVIANSEMRFAQGWSTALAYSAFFGGGSNNLLHDRDFVQVGIRYRF
jgi:hypothetical protein